MTVCLKKWGNSYAIRIPKDFVQSLSIDVEDEVEIRLVDGSLLLTPKKRRLESLVSKIDPKNLHGEVSTGESVGHETW